MPSLKSTIHRFSAPAKLIPKNHDRNESHLEKLGREIGVTYVELDGDIGIISSGAGLGMATMDIIGQRLRPANFLETGGAITEDLLYKTMDLVLTKKGLQGDFHQFIRRHQSDSRRRQRNRPLYQRA